jgi:prepilin-type N-terminal cleavage/methylation domain-containing protein
MNVEMVSALNSSLDRARRDEGGFTLVELLVAMTLLVGVMAGATTLLVGIMQKQPGASDRTQQVAEARIALERMVREIRPGYVVDSTTGTASTVTFRTYMHHTCAGATSTTVNLCRVTYSCSTTTKVCTRSTANADGTAPTAARRVITGITNTDVFTIQSSYIGIKFVMPSEDGRGAITVSDGATLRNATLGL